MENEVSTVNIRNKGATELNEDQHLVQGTTNKNTLQKTNSDKKLIRSFLKRKKSTTMLKASQRAKNNTLRKTNNNINLLQSFLKANGELRPIKTIPVKELNQILCEFFLNARKLNGSYYKMETLRGIMCSIDHYLNQINYGFSIKRSSEFFEVRMVFTDKKRQAVQNRINESEPVSDHEIELLWERQQFGTHTPDSLIETLCFFNCVYFDLRWCATHKSLRWGDVKLCCDASGIEYLEYTKKRSRNRQEETKKVFASSKEPNRCPVKIFKVYASKRPEDYSHPNDPFYLATLINKKESNENWFKRQAIGVHKLAAILKLSTKLAGIGARMKT